MDIKIDKDSKNPLRQEARQIKNEEFGTPYLKDVIQVMQGALAKESDGVAFSPADSSPS
jgi:hypothetical protein